jgi:hypothetical protein
VKALYTYQHDRDAFPLPQYRLLSPEHNIRQLTDYLSNLVASVPQVKHFKRGNPEDATSPTLDGELSVKCGKNHLVLKFTFMADIIKTWLRLQPQDEIRMADLLALRLPDTADGCRIVVDALADLEENFSQTKIQRDRCENELAALVAEYYALDASDMEVVTNFLNLF